MVPMLLAFLLLAAPACAGSRKAQEKSDELPGSVEAPPLRAGEAEAIFAGGCFWCMEAPFDKLPGVISTSSGYTGGKTTAPSYHLVGMGFTGHTEAIRVVYDPKKVTYAELLDVFWHNVDPTQAGGQFCDIGDQYRTGIFTSDPAERALAEASKEKVATQLGRPIVTPIEPKAAFWLAEDYHQDFYKKDPERYTSYRRGCGRDRRLAELWGASDH
jgi:peptide-methionine (S)-S-oxide reductase